MQDEPIDAPPPTMASAPVATTPVPVPPPSPDTAEIAADPGIAPDESAANPAWANDLRKLYDAVVEEPLPDSLLDLLSQLDAED